MEQVSWGDSEQSGSALGEDSQEDDDDDDKDDDRGNGRPRFDEKDLDALRNFLSLVKIRSETEETTKVAKVLM